MKIGIIGLGKMGFNLSKNLLRNNHEVAAFDTDNDIKAKARAEGIETADSLKDLCGKLGGRKIIWIMIPNGLPVDNTIKELLPELSEKDIIIDGGNSNYKESVRRHNELKERNIDFIDCGTSGGTSGALNGACLMVGGDTEPVSYCGKIFTDIAVKDGYLHVGEAGSGHFTKMVHNGIEYGMMQSIAEGFEILDKSSYNMDYEKVARVWNNGSVIESWLMELTENLFRKDAKLEKIKGIMNSSGEGKWTVETALDLEVPAPVIALSLMMRYRSLEENTFSGRVIAALRNEFGGHKVEKA
ncbi:phosphogluconate dehydrogenase (NAD(+)-dependent, decarboxylating) [Sebaldella sp. S0638]|uniref:phosphogluconate dehydrogenase (NAD(+)-dependent, decarboxylating) n=1 Tax=Sebaldella sp. S0638 TaxID=2957809 RepID=UPI0020A1FB78|nr:decarboxylating 6-phosphogluconate dehydrogenase [Sebaldella sp. S0638]MCP1222869.1 decarboxylating 6-phosphogluconate dehydrogenase [Sebaldella sp. S0638]